MSNDHLDYSPEFFSALRESSETSARRIVPFLLDRTAARSVVDFGCGDGTWLSVFEDNGLDVLGIDGEHVDQAMLRIDTSSFLAMDLRDPASPNRPFDLATCFEVAEHLPDTASEALVSAIVASADVVVFGAAVPGQPGTNHINTRWQSYWSDLFGQHGYFPDDCIRREFWTDPQVSYWYSQNALLYTKGGAGMSGPIDIVHPRMVEAVLELWQVDLARSHEVGIKEQVRGIPAAIRATIGARRP